MVLSSYMEWNIRYGEWWMIQWQFAGWISFGIHIDPLSRKVAAGPFAGKTYGPYIDIHLGCFIFSFGVRPYLTGELINQSGIARGGFSIISDKPLKIGKIEIGFRTFIEIILIILLILSIYRTFLSTFIVMQLKQYGNN